LRRGALMEEALSHYDTDITTWAREQADAIRRRAMNEIDWTNVAEEIESVGRSETDAVASLLTLAVGHKLRLLTMPEANAARHWEGEIRTWLATVVKKHRPSMHIRIEDVYDLAVVATDAYMPGLDLPDVCPWTLDELLAEGEAALRRRR